MSNESAENRELGTKKISSLVLKYCEAGVLGLLFQGVQVSLDGYFMGNGLGEIGLQTIAIVVPLLSFAMAIGCMIAVGATSFAATSLGEGKTKEARKFFGTSVWFGLFFGTAIGVAGFFFAEQVAMLLGATGEMVEPCRQYIERFFVFFPFFVEGCVFYYFVRLDEKPFLGTLAFIVPVIYAEIVEYCCVYLWGVGTASSSTAYGLTVGSWSLCGLYFLFNKKTIFKVKLSDAKICFKEVAGICKAGMAAFSVQIAIALVAVIINQFLVAYATDADNAAFGVLNGYIMYIGCLIVTLGFAPGLQPIASFNYGARAFERVRNALNVTIAYHLVVISAIVILVFLLQEPILRFFIGSNEAVMDAAKNHMLPFLGLFSFGTVSFVVSGYYQAIAKDGIACVVALLRNVIFLLPALILLVPAIGNDGIWLSMALSDLLAFGVSMLLVVRENKRLNMMRMP